MCNKRDYKNVQGHTGKRMSAWKKYGAFMLSGVLLAGTAVVYAPGAASAEEGKQRVTLNMADSGETEAVDAGIGETEDDTAETAAETENIQPETYEALTSVAAVEDAVTAVDVSRVVENCMPSIVAIVGQSGEASEDDSDDYPDYYGYYGYYYGEDEADDIAADTEVTSCGFIIAQNEEELLIAADSDIAGASELTVYFQADAEDEDDLEASARLKAVRNSYGIAVLAVRLSDIPETVREQLKIAAIGSSSEIKPGAAAIVVSNLFGNYCSVTSGIISGVGLEADGYETSLMVSDAEILSGTGGVLLNTSGEVAALCIAGEGISYCIPMDEAAEVLENLANQETRDKLSDSQRGYIGVTVVDVSDDAKELYDMPEGVFVYEVTEGSAGDEAGIRKGDIITKIDGEEISSSSELIEKLTYYAVGETVVLEVQTANNGSYDVKEVEVTLQASGDSEDADGETEADEGSGDESGDLFSGFGERDMY